MYIIPLTLIFSSPSYPMFGSIKLNYLFLLLTSNELSMLTNVNILSLEGANFKQGSAEEKAKIYYESCLDRNDTVESRGTKPMQDLIESVSDN